MEKQQNLFQTFFRNELTWLGMVILAIWGFVTSVVLPLQKLQIQVAQIQTQLKSQSDTYNSFSQSVQNISTKQQLDEQEISQLENNIHTSK